MVKVVASIEIYGANFSPAKVIDQLGNIFSDFDIKGEIGKRGRFKGRKVPYGSASVKPPEVINESDRIIWLTNFLNQNIDNMRKNGGEDISITVGYFYNGQCNCELTAEEINGLASLNIPFILSL